MKYQDGAIVNVPYIGLRDGETTHEWASFKFDNTVDLRRIRRMVRRWVKHQLGRSLHTSELKQVCHPGRIALLNGPVDVSDQI